MKTIYLYLFLIGIILSSCDKGFVEVNTNPVQPTSLDPAYLLTNAQVNAMMYNIQYASPIAQQIITPFGSTLEGGHHNIWYEPGDGSIAWGELYPCINLLTDIIAKTKDNPSRSNIYNMARIWKAYCSQVLVDAYGYVPYSEAGQAYLNGIFLPKYDIDSEIYDDLLKELSEAVAALDATGTIEKVDLFYGGDIAKWKKLGNSLLLRVAMRYSKNNPTKAQQWVATAVNPANGGLMSSVEDNAKVVCNDSYLAPTAGTWQGTERANYYIAKPFIDALQTTHDPRLSRIAVRYEFPANDLASAGYADTTIAGQIGMPLGYNDATIVLTPPPDYPGKSGAAWKYSQVNRTTLGKSTATYFFVTYCQTQLLLAEAVKRGWASGNVADIYNAAVKGGMDQMAQYDALATIPLAEQDAYLAANPFDDVNAYEQINTQYWVNCFAEGYEAWSNHRRSGFPALTPNPYPGADPVVTAASAGGFVHRLQIQNSERSVNVESYNAAVQAMGPDNMGTRVFWDKEP
jgi:hypothetical protein